MKIQELTQSVGEVIRYLRSNGFDQEASELESLLRQAAAGNADAARGIHERCHIKWLGDIPIQELSDIEWLNLLDRVKKSC